MTYKTQNISEGVDWKPSTIKQDSSLYNWPFYPLKGLIWMKSYLFFKYYAIRDQSTFNNFNSFLLNNNNNNSVDIPSS